MTGTTARPGAVATVDLRRAPLSTLRALDFRAPDRDFLHDDASLWDRFRASWAGLDDAAWRLPGAAPSDAGGPDWSLLDHVAHVLDWQEIAVDYVGRVLAGDAWPSDDDFDGGDFDRFNEGRRARWAPLAPATIRASLTATHERLVGLVRRLPPGTVRRDEAWGWVHMVLHGHVLDHLGVLEPWEDGLRARQAEGDPFLDDPRPAGDGSLAAIERFWAAEAAVFGQFDELVRPIPVDRWEERGPTPEWSLKDHVAHLARWFEEGGRAIEAQRATGAWETGPEDGLDAWNAREADAARLLPPAQAIERFDAGRARLTRIVRSMAPDELASPEGGDWAFECLHGHVRAHLAMIGPWAVRTGWPST